MHVYPLKNTFGSTLIWAKYEVFWVGLDVMHGSHDSNVLPGNSIESGTQGTPTTECQYGIGSSLDTFYVSRLGNLIHTLGISSGDRNTP